MARTNNKAMDKHSKILLKTNNRNNNKLIKQVKNKFQKQQNKLIKLRIFNRVRSKLGEDGKRQ